VKRPPLLAIFLTVFIDLVGFAIVLPLLPIYGRDLGASGFVIGLLMASFSAMQFLCAPAWGRLSDRIGRRPVLLVSLGGSALSYAVFAAGSTLPDHGAALAVLLASRILAGVCGANIPVAQAYIADVTPPADRSKRMGLIGMAFGLGFIFGPALGAVSYATFGLAGPGWVAATLCAANLGLTALRLPESRHPGSVHAAEPVPVARWRETLARPRIGALVALFFVATFCFTCFETTLGLVISRDFHLNFARDDHAKATVGYLFAFCGLIGAAVQGGAIGPLVRRFGEARLIGWSLVITAAGMVPIPFVHGLAPFSLAVLARPEGRPWLELLGLLALLAVGSSLTRPPVFGLLSIHSPAHEQGATIGVAQSAGSLARILGPLFAASLFDRHPAAPYVVCGAILVATGVLVMARRHALAAATDGGARSASV
jgi:MFS family permease